MARKNRQPKDQQLIEQINEDQMLDLMEDIQHEEQALKPSTIVSDTSNNSQMENTAEDTENDLATLLERDKAELLRERDELLKKLAKVNEHLFELGHNEQVGGQSKMNMMRPVYQIVSTRKDFITKGQELGIGKPYLSTMWNLFKHGK